MVLKRQLSVCSISVNDNGQTGKHATCSSSSIIINTSSSPVCINICTISSATNDCADDIDELWDDISPGNFTHHVTSPYIVHVRSIFSWRPMQTPDMSTSPVETNVMRFINGLSSTHVGNSNVGDNALSLALMCPELWPVGEEAVMFTKFLRVLAERLATEVMLVRPAIMAGTEDDDDDICLPEMV